MVLNHPLDVCGSEAVGTNTKTKAVERLQSNHYVIDLSRRYLMMNTPLCEEHKTHQVNGGPVVSN